MKRSLASLIACLAAAHAGAEEFSAVLDWSQRVVLGTPVSGVVTATPAAAGERVSEGHVLAQLDLRPFESAQRDAEAQVRKHRLNRDEAERELQRTRELYARTVISLHDLQVQEIAFAEADADYASAVARLEAARLHLDYATVRAPFPGRVLEVSTAPGETVVNAQQATPLVTLVRDRPMSARALVPADAAGALARGQTAGVRINGETYPATVERVGMEPDADGRYALAVSFDPGDAVLRAGLPAQIETGR
jgi:multidrug efflux system membrane fusion protein